jgi:AraC family transcriptional regulator
MAVGMPADADWKILHATARRHSWRGEGWLSVKCFCGGRAQYSVGRGHYAVDDGCYLILNHGREYSIEIDSPSSIESFCIFFQPDFAADALSGCLLNDRALIDRSADGTAPVQFFEKTYPHDRLVSPWLQRLKHSHRNAERGFIEEQLHFAFGGLLRAHRAALRQADALQSVRAATRHELYRRVGRARDFANAMFAERLTLRDLAEAAALSPNHLLRTFAQVYRQTPHQFLTARRLDEAARLLVRTELPVTEVCLAVGFESLGSFSSLFKRHFGSSPAQYRNLKR